MARVRGSRNAGVRFRDGGWELQCNDCARVGGTSYWPLTNEFWDHWRGMNRCRACHDERRNRLEREKYAADPAYRASRREQNRQYRREMARIIYKERWDKLRADPEKYAAYIEARRARQRSASAKHRVKVMADPTSRAAYLAKRRARYHELAA